jgi:hypothetical protein
MESSLQTSKKTLIENKNDVVCLIKEWLGNIFGPNHFPIEKQFLTNFPPKDF